MAREHASGIFILRKDGKLLICHPTNHAVDFYSIPKGKIELGETKIEAAIRETFEETNIDLFGTNDFHITQLESVGYRSGKKTLHPFLYQEKLISTFDWENIEIKCNSNVPIERGGFPEMDGYKWVEISEAKPLLHETQVIALSQIEDIL
jgi:8-oxo-dGTP pyrophosphatase MutT (NUDIX family)